eukprot:COSAG04_NODE_45_length_31617_cov_47.863284_9_plen_186_part_00
MFSCSKVKVLLSFLCGNSANLGGRHCGGYHMVAVRGMPRRGGLALLLLAAAVGATGGARQQGLSVLFGRPVLINDGAAKPQMMYLRGGVQAPDDPRAILIEEKGNSLDWGSVGGRVYATADGGRSWRLAWNITTAGQRGFKTVMVPASGGAGAVHDLAFWGGHPAFPLDKRLGSINVPPPPPLQP